VSCFGGVSRFDPPNAAEACQLATGLNRWNPLLIVAVVTFRASFSGIFSISSFWACLGGLLLVWACFGWGRRKAGRLLLAAILGVTVITRRWALGWLQRNLEDAFATKNSKE